MVQENDSPGRIQRGFVGVIEVGFQSNPLLTQNYIFIGSLG